MKICRHSNAYISKRAAHYTDVQICLGLDKAHSFKIDGGLPCPCLDNSLDNSKYKYKQSMQRGRDWAKIHKTSKQPYQNVDGGFRVFLVWEHTKTDWTLWYGKSVSDKL